MYEPPKLTDEQKDVIRDFAKQLACGRPEAVDLAEKVGITTAKRNEPMFTPAFVFHQICLTTATLFIAHRLLELIFGL